MNDLVLKKSSSEVFKLDENNLVKRPSMIDRMKQQVKNIDNREDANFDPTEDYKNYLMEKDLVKNLDTFEMKVAPTALHIFAENLNVRLKNVAFS